MLVMLSQNWTQTLPKLKLALTGRCLFKTSLTQIDDQSDMSSKKIGQIQGKLELKYWLALLANLP